MPQPWLIQSKLRPPQIGGAVPRRGDLLDPRKNVLRPRVTLVVGPPGYGKTTLLAQWIAAVGRQDALTAWLTVDEDDREFTQFAAYVLAALMAAEGEEKETDILRQGVLADNPGVFKMALADVLGRLPGHIILFIDDYHRAASPQNDRLLEFLLSAAPDRLHLVLACRNRPNLQVSGYQMKGMLREISVAELAFDADETASFLDKEKSKLDLAQIEARFEGWPAGLQLARLWFHRTSERERTASSLTGRSTDLARYMTEQVFLSLDTDLQGFLLRTSILERLNGDVANAVAQRNDGWIMLEAIERQSLFLLPIDSEGEWFRFHTLFAEFLQERLRRSLPGEEAACHRRAAEWFAANGYIREALSHARRCGDPEYYVRLIERLGGWRLMLRIGTSILQVTEDLGLDLLDKSPSLGLGYVYTLAQQGRITEAEQWFERLREKTDDFHVYRGKDWDSAIYADSKALEYVLHLYRDDNPSAEDIQQTEALLHDLADPNPVVGAILKNLFCYALYFEARFEESIEAGWKAAENCRRLNLAYAENYLYPFIGAAYFAIGRLDRACAVYNEVRSHIIHDFGYDNPQIEIANLYLGHHAYELDNLEEADRLVAHALPVIEVRDGWVEAYVAGYGSAARIAYLKHDLGHALTVLERGRRIAEVHDLWRLRAEIEALEVILLLRAGVRDEAVQKITWGKATGYFNLGNYEKRNQNWLTAPTVANAVAQGALAIGDTMAAMAATRFLSHIAKTSGNKWAEVIALILNALTLECMDSRPQALSALTSALAIGRDCGYRRTFLDFGDPLMKLVRVLYDRKGAEVESVRAFAASLIGQRKIEQDNTTSLSSREREILSFIADGLSNKEIATRLKLTAGTVKTYRKRLYQKLVVSSRSQAIARARELSLIQ